MKELSIADLIELMKHCNNMLIGTMYVDHKEIDYLFAIQDACNKELIERMDKIHSSLPNNTSTT
jgi:hypothetical protein